jgi:hypothetical protein
MGIASTVALHSSPVTRQEPPPGTPGSGLAREPPLFVFSQASDARVDIRAWDAHAQRFFRTRLALAEEGRVALRGPSPETLGARPPLGHAFLPEDAAAAAGDIAFVIATDGEAPGVRTARARRREPEDLAMAERADRAGSGLALLARRCPMIWRIASESSGDRLALRLAAILASVLLGPILDVRVPELLGVKSARARLDRS